MRGLWAGGAIGFFAACQGGRYFTCSDDGDCPGGRCEPVAAACSFPDVDCPTGHRFGEAGDPAIAGDCVPVPANATDTTDALADTGTTATPTTDDATETSADDGSAASSTTGAPACPPSWWDCAWTQRHRVTLAVSPGEIIEGVPVLVLLSSTRVDHARMQQDGEDVRFVAADGQTALPFEIERWDPAGVSTFWVTLDRLGHADEALWIYYGNPVAEGAEDPTAVWTAPHAAVWHMGDAWVDASGAGHDLAPTGAIETASGQIVEATSFASSGARLDVQPAPGLADLPGPGFTLSAWVRLRSFGGGGFGRIAHKEFEGTGWQWYVATGGELRLAVGYGSTTIMWGTAGGVVELDRWQHVAATFSHLPGAVPRLFVDGVEHEIVSGGPAPREEPVSDADIPLRLGNRNTDRRFDGLLDEVRIEQTVRSPSWLRIQHAAGTDTLLEFGPREALEIDR